MRGLIVILGCAVLAACQSSDPYLGELMLEREGLYASTPAAVVTIDEAMNGGTMSATIARAATSAPPEPQPSGLYAALQNTNPTAQPVSAPRAATSSPQMPTRSGLAALHVASFPDAEAVLPGWQTIVAAGHQALAGLTPRVERVHLGPDRGVYHRLKLGPIASEADARARCATLTRTGAFCKVTTFDGEPLEG